MVAKGQKIYGKILEIFQDFFGKIWQILESFRKFTGTIVQDFFAIFFENFGRFLETYW